MKLDLSDRMKRYEAAGKQLLQRLELRAEAAGRRHPGSRWTQGGGTVTDARLLLAATLALLEGWSGPVVVDGRATVAWWDNGASSVWVETTPDGDGYWSSADMVSVALDLSRAECRDRVVRVVARVVTRSSTHCGARFRPGVVAGLWCLHGDDAPYATFSRAGGGGWVTVDALADLDPYDDTRLPDGSRLVDALALALVARHVLELGVGR